MPTPEFTPTRISRYATASQSERVEFAVEMMEEIIADKERFYAIAAAIVTQLKPRGDDDCADPVAFRLAEVLENVLADTDQQNRLLDCIKSMRTSTAH